MGRKPISERPMTPAERMRNMRRRRAAERWAFWQTFMATIAEACPDKTGSRRVKGGQKGRVS